jgi:hypothetical protein
MSGPRSSGWRHDQSHSHGGLSRSLDHRARFRRGDLVEQWVAECHSQDDLQRPDDRRRVHLAQILGADLMTIDPVALLCVSILVSFLIWARSGIDLLVKAFYGATTVAVVLLAFKLLGVI